MEAFTVRPALQRDLVDLGRIERAAGARFREYDLDEVADDEPPTVEQLAGFMHDGRAWVAVDEADRAVGYLLIEELDGAAHIEQVTVAPAHQGRGLGRALVDQAAGWTADQGWAAVTLVTFDHIPWNRPWYKHLGFEVIRPPGLTPGLRSRVEAEPWATRGPGRRVTMRAQIDGTGRIRPPAG